MAAKVQAQHPPVGGQQRHHLWSCQEIVGQVLDLFSGCGGLSLGLKRAGFAGRELSALWPDEAGWQLDERPAAPFSHLFVARRDALP